jgi:hypothetical protein
MTNPKLKRLLQVSAEIINLYLIQYDCNPTDPEFTVSPFYDNTEKHSESVNINFNNWDFSHEFLEPLAEKLSKTDVKWSIAREEKQFQLSLYF